MSDRVQWIEYNGKKVLISNYSGLKGEELLNAIQQGINEALNSGLKKIYMINDVSYSYMNKESTNEVKNWVRACKDKGIELKVALTGLSEIRKFLAQTFSKEIYFAKDMDDAKSWIDSQ